MSTINSASTGTTREAQASSLLTDLYVSLRRSLQKWAAVTHQTPQPRMGYVGQHLVSVVTGHPGGRSGARGDDIKLPNGRTAEIKCCYRVDQLGICKKCGAKVASIEKVCPIAACGSREIIRKDDSKWLLSPKSEEELRKLFEPEKYYFVLFEFTDMSAADDIDVKIFEVNPRAIGFGLCVIDYYFNIRSKSKSAAPFNIWPGSLKFALMKPELIYWSIIKPDDSIETKTFPEAHKPMLQAVGLLQSYANSDTLTDDAIEELAETLNVDVGDPALPKTKRKRREVLLAELQKARELNKVSDSDLADTLARIILRPRLEKRINWVKEFAPEAG